MGVSSTFDATAHALLSADAVALTDDHDILRFVSVSGLALLGYTSAELVGKPLVNLVHPADWTKAGRMQRSTAGSVDPGAISLRYRCKDGSYAPLTSKSRGLLDSLTGVLVESQALIREVGQLKEAQAGIERSALTDSLTGLANRTLLSDRLNQGIRHIKRSSGFVGVLMLDLDHFKVINDTMGHEVGDEVLIETARRLERLARPEDTVARFGGDEFVVVVQGLDDPADLTGFADRIVGGLGAPYHIGREEVVATVSIGIAVASQPDALGADLLREADMAMYAAKDHGRDRHEVYGVALQVRATERLETERLVRRALADDLLLVEYQPILDLPSGTTVGAEALLRIVDSKRGHFSPAQFLLVAQETGLLPVMDQRVRATAFRDLARWRHDPVSSGFKRLALNLTARELADPAFTANLAASIEAAAVKGSDLGIEVTEHVLMQTSHSAVASLTQLREIGIHIGLDDFGTGFSALSYLQSFPLDFLKIDKSFIDSIDADSRSSAIVAAMIELAHALGLYVVAEGVETSAQMTRLRDLGCDQAQGYLFAPSLASPDFLERLDRMG